MELNKLIKAIKSYCWSSIFFQFSWIYYHKLTLKIELFIDMNFKNNEEETKLVYISEPILISIIEENKMLKEKVVGLENIIGDLSRKWQLEKENNKQLNSILYNGKVLGNNFEE